jgi:predicted O-methyltransferase YrrM
LPQLEARVFSLGASAAHLLRYYAGLDDAHTQVSAAEQECLKRHATGKVRVVEIGVFEGVGTRVLAGAVAEGAELFAIDPFLTGRLGINWGKPIARSEIRRANSRGTVDLVTAFSWEAAKRLDGTFDMIFIDGDHSLEGIQRDWQDWSCRIRADGIVALHDTRVPVHNPHVAELGSYQYFNTHIKNDPRFLLCEQVDSLSVMRRIND